MFPESRQMFPESRQMFPESRQMFPESRQMFPESPPRMFFPEGGSRSKATHSPPLDLAPPSLAARQQQLIPKSMRSYPILSCHILSCPILSYPIISYHILL
jgi:hypothetical protein